MRQVGKPRGRQQVRVRPGGQHQQVDVRGTSGLDQLAGDRFLALFSASAIATLITMALPWTLHRLGRDPAFGSGPLATVIQDLLTIVIYFVTATAIAI